MECTKPDKTSNPLAIQPTTASEHVQNKDEIKDFIADVSAKLQERNTKIQGDIAEIRQDNNARFQNMQHNMECSNVKL